MKRYLIIHHDADYDGILSNEVCRYFLSKIGKVESVGWDYGKPLLSIVSETDEVYMVDISIDGMMDTPKMTWIDHHATAIAKFPASIPGYRVDGVAACRLCWQWFLSEQGTKALPEKEHYTSRKVTEPLLVRLVGEHDIWDHRDERALILQSGLRELELSEFQALITEQFETINDHALLNECLKIGVRAMKSRDRANTTTIKKFGHTVRWHGLNFLCCNGLQSSTAFVAGIKSEHEALMGWRYDGQTKRCTVSMYHAPGHENFDLSNIAVAFGGGGHKGACGFQCSLEEMNTILQEKAHA